MPHPLDDDDAMYDALTTEPTETRAVRYERGRVTAGVEVYVRTRDGRPAYAVQDDDERRVLGDANAAARVAWEVLADRLSKAVERVEKDGPAPVRRQLMD